MIIAAVSALVLLFGGGDFSFDHIAKAAEEVIQDKDTAGQVIAITEQANESLVAFNEKLQEHGKQYAELNADYLATREELQAMANEISKGRRQFLEQLVAFRFQLQDLVTADEFQEMVVKRKQLY